MHERTTRSNDHPPLTPRVRYPDAAPAYVERQGAAAVERVGPPAASQGEWRTQVRAIETFIDSLLTKLANEALAEIEDAGGTVTEIRFACGESGDSNMLAVLIVYRAPQ